MQSDSDTESMSEQADGTLLVNGSGGTSLVNGSGLEQQDEITSGTPPTKSGVIANNDRSPAPMSGDVSSC